VTIVALKNAADEATFGGKAASLARAIAAGLPVPEGYAVSWDDEVVGGRQSAVGSGENHSGEVPRVRSSPGSADSDAHASSPLPSTANRQPPTLGSELPPTADRRLPTIASELLPTADRRLPANGPPLLPTADCRLPTLLLDAFYSLGSSVALRSSAIGEDSLEASFAGQHVTVLNVTSEEMLREAVQTIIESAHAESALAYRKKMGVEGPPRIAVVMQRMIEPDAAGVLFTRNPVTGAHERVIESAWGLGEAVVAGLVTPDRFRISPSGEILERTAGKKDLVIRFADGGGTIEQPVPPEEAARLSLDDAQLRALHELAERCESYFGAPQDMEWAVVGSEVFLLQSRPITRAKDAEEPVTTKLTPRRFTGLALAALLAPLNSTIIAVALPSITNDFATSAAVVTRWMVTAYLVVSIVAQSPAGKLADLFGYSRVLTLGRFSFGAGALLAAFSPSLPILGLGRVLMALGGALSIPTVFAQLRNSVPADRRGRIFGVFGAIMGTAAAVGPVIGGFLTARFGWHSVFFVNVPVVLLSLLLEPPRAGERTAAAPRGRFDFLGSALLGVAVLLLVAAVERTSVLIAIGALAALIAFVIRELRASDPVLDVRLFRRPAFAAGGAIVALQNLAMYSMLFLLPFYLQSDASRTGTLLLLFTAGMVLASPLGGRLSDAIGSRIVGVTGALIATGGAALFISGSGLILSLILVGVGIGIGTSPSQAAAMNAVSAREAGVASGALSTLRYVGGVVGSGLVALIAGGAVANDARLIVFPAVLLLSGIVALALPGRLRGALALLLILLLSGTAGAQTAPDVKALLDRGTKHEEAGRIEEAGRDYLAARDAAQRLGDRRLLAEALVHLGFIDYYRGDMNDALVNLQRGYDLNTAIGNDEGRRLSLTNIAHVYADSRVAQFDRAIEYYRQLLPEYEAAGDAINFADTLFNLGSTHDRKGDFAAALEWHRRALAAEEKLGRLDEAAYVKRSIAITLVRLDRAPEALPLLDEALAFFREEGDEERAMQVRQSRGIAYRKLGRLDGAIADLEASRAYFASQKNARFLEKSQDELALAYAEAGRWQEAFRARSAQAALQRELAEKLREEHTSRLRVQFDAEKKEQENRALLRVNSANARIRSLQTIILILGAAIIAVLAYLAMRLRTMAMTDELTRLPNRRRLLSAAELELQRTRAGGDPFSLIAFDIDHFKRVNDTWGHAAGDLVLQRVAHACRNMLRPSDSIGRIGGEEFTVILPSTRLDAASQVAERLRAAVERIDCRDIDPSLRVTISLGVAEWNGEETVARIAGRADEVLYRAKERGRNRVEPAVA
jgi:EmrB/QacA subfamily drug resistance transporter